MKNEISYREWHDDEKRWWDEHGQYMTYQWTLTPSLNAIIRTGWVNDFTDYLFSKQGKLLDMGCGGGWLSLNFAKKGMIVLGVDVSSEQIKNANILKDRSKVNDVMFECSDLIGWDCSKYRENFDSVFVNAFLHHLPPEEISVIFKHIDFILKKGGRCYLYEPLTSIDKKRPFFVSIINAFIERLVGLCVGKIPKMFNLWSDQYKKELMKGYTMRSPHEGPIEWLVINNILPSSMSIAGIRGWHLHSLGLAMQIMSLKDSIRGTYTHIARFFYLLDRILLSVFDWQSFAYQGRFVLCGIKLIKS